MTKGEIYDKITKLSDETAHMKSEKNRYDGDFRTETKWKTMETEKRKEFRIGNRQKQKFKKVFKKVLTNAVKCDRIIKSPNEREKRQGP